MLIGSSFSLMLLDVPNQQALPHSARLHECLLFYSHPYSLPHCLLWYEYMHPSTSLLHYWQLTGSRLTVAGTKKISETFPKKLFRISKPSFLFFPFLFFSTNHNFYKHNRTINTTRYTLNSRSRELLSSFPTQIIKTFTSQSLQEYFAHFFTPPPPTNLTVFWISSKSL